MATDFRLTRATALQSLMWLGGVVALTLLMLLVRDRLDKAHVALLYLMLVLGASAVSGRTSGILVAVITFMCFNFFFLPPFSTFIIADPLDWLVLLTYLATAGIAAQLFHRAKLDSETAQQRASEIERLSSLGAETLNVGRAEDALGAIASVIRTTLHIARAELYMQDPREEMPRLIVQSPRERADAEATAVPPLVVYVAREGVPAAVLMDGTTRMPDTRHSQASTFGDFDFSDACVLMFPLRMRDRTVGVLRLVHDSAIPFMNTQRQFVGVLSYYAALGVERVRLTAQAEHASALAEADRLKDALLATVSHDLRTPLTTIKATAHEIAESGDPRGSAIEKQADRLNDLVADLLDLSKLQSGGVILEKEVNTAEDLIGAALQQLSGTLGNREVRISIEPPEAVLTGRFDFVHSLRVLVNLIENAHKYSPAEQPIDLGARRDGNVLVFSVSDRGPGIPNLERHLIYQPFYRSKATTGAVDGTGLGLAIANRLAELQGGVLRHMPRSGGGTVFVFRVPAGDISNEPAQASQPALS